MNKYLKTLALLAALLAAGSAFGQTTTTISRLQLEHPDLGYPGGSALHDVVATLYEKIGDNMNSRYAEFSNVADSAVTTWTHNLGVSYSEMSCFLYTGTAPTLTRVALPISAAGWTIAENATNPKTQIDITAPSSGGPHDFAVMCVQGWMPERVDDLKNVDLSSAAQDGQALVYDGTAGKWVAGASGDASFKLQTISTSTLTLKGGYLVLDDGRELATYDGSGSTAADFGVDITADLSTVLGSSPADATAYYLYIDLNTLPAATTLADTGRKLIGVTSANLALSTSAPDAVQRSRYVPLGVIHSATTGTAWTGSGASFSTLAVRRHQTGPQYVSPVVYSQAPVAVTAVGTTGFPPLGHALADEDFPVTTGKIAFFHLADAGDDSSALSCSSGTAACDLTNNGSVTFASTGIDGVSSTAASFNGTSQSLSKADAFLKVSASDSYLIGGWFAATDWTPSSIQTLFGLEYDTSTNRGMYVVVNTDGTVLFTDYGDATSATQAVVTSPITGFADGSWHHVAIGYDASADRLSGYLDGRLVGSVPLAKTATAANQIFRIAARENTAASFYAGLADEVFFMKNTTAATDADNRKLAARKISHLRNVAADKQLVTGGWGRSDSAVTNQLDSGWIVHKGANALYADFSGVAAGAFVDFAIQDLSPASGVTVPSRPFDVTYTSTPPTTIAHGLPSAPAAFSVAYEVSAGTWRPMGSGEWCDADATNLTCDWTGFPTVDASHRAKITASVADVVTSVPLADATAPGLVSTGAQTIAGDKEFTGNTTFSGDVTLSGNVTRSGEDVVFETMSAGVTLTGTISPVLYDTEVIDALGSFSAGVFTCQSPGLYRVTFDGHTTKSSGTAISDDVWNIDILKNGSTYGGYPTQVNGGVTGSVTFSRTVIVNLSAGDTVTTRVLYNMGGSRTYTGTLVGHLSINKL